MYSLHTIELVPEILFIINPFHALGLFLYPLKTSDHMLHSNLFTKNCLRSPLSISLHPTLVHQNNRGPFYGPLYNTCKKCHEGLTIRGISKTISNI